MKKIAIGLLSVLLVIFLLATLALASYQVAKHFGYFGLGEQTVETVTAPSPSDLDEEAPDLTIEATSAAPASEVTITGTCTEANLVPGSQNGGRVELNLDNGDSHSWSVTVINPDLPSGDATLVIVTEPLMSIDIEYPVMYFTSARFNGTQEEVLCSADKLTDGSGELYVYVGSPQETPLGWTPVSEATGWWDVMTVWEYGTEAIDAGIAIEHFIGAQDLIRTIDAAEVALAHGQFWRPGYPGKVVHPQVAHGYSLTLPGGWQGTFWTYALPNADIQARIIEASEDEVVSRDEIGSIVLLYCGPTDTVPTTSFEFRGVTITWVTTLDGWTCTGPASE